MDVFECAVRAPDPDWYQLQSISAGYSVFSTVTCITARTTDCRNSPSFSVRSIVIDNTVSDRLYNVMELFPDLGQNFWIPNVCRFVSPTLSLLQDCGLFVDSDYVLYNIWKRCLSPTLSLLLHDFSTLEVLRTVLFVDLLYWPYNLHWKSCLQNSLGFLIYRISISVGFLMWIQTQYIFP